MKLGAPAANFLEPSREGAPALPIGTETKRRCVGAPAAVNVETRAGGAPMPRRRDLDTNLPHGRGEPVLLLNVLALPRRYTFISPSREGSHALPIG